ncbi:ATP-binding protein [Heyndrickxia oleronia]|uniref:histidine kinase N-terminal domain-containing protein n=1 Tax=Heyndrickxia oleronia TaxID=38875 RepID=UPI00203A64D4|nr:histidine kinase N-terminal domain-containing protein [Heyndrickxia oleronia]MCM3456981.1 ATP-binding protein [Heyndrickxia oleronia]
MIPLRNDIVSFLEKNKEPFLMSWEKQTIITGKDSINDFIFLYGDVMYDLLYKSIILTYEEMNLLIEPFAKNIARDRMIEQIGMGEFVYKINIGKTILCKDLLQHFSDIGDFPPFLDRICHVFDKFLFYAVTHYTDIKDQIIEEKNQYITSTHHERLTLLGQMTSSFVHEFRNPLTSIHGFVQLLRSEHPTLPYLDIIANELEQLKFSISQFLMLSKKEIIELEKTSFSLNELIDEVLSFLYPRILEVNVEIQKNFLHELTIHGFKDAIRQVLINIIFNAVDVLKNIKNPIIQIELDQTTQSVILDIANNGPRISEGLVDNIFEPFVTTKETGTGLGLYVSKNTIEKHGGTLTCQSNDEWTVFTIILPLK